MSLALYWMPRRSSCCRTFSSIVGREDSRNRSATADHDRVHPLALLELTAVLVRGRHRLERADAHAVHGAATVDVGAHHERAVAPRPQARRERLGALGAVVRDDLDGVV